QRALKRLLDPPRGVRAEAEASTMVELLRRAKKADVAFLNEVEEGNAAAEILAREEHHQTKVAREQAIACALELRLRVLDCENGLCVGRALCCGASNRLDDRVSNVAIEAKLGDLVDVACAKRFDEILRYLLEVDIRLVRIEK